MRIRRTDGFNTGNVVPLRPPKSSSPSVSFADATELLKEICRGKRVKPYLGPLLEIEEVRNALVQLLCEAMGDCPDPRIKALQRLVQNG